MKKNRWSTIPPISTKRTKSPLTEHKKLETMTYDVGNIGPGLGEGRQAQKCCGIKPVNGILTLLS
jgi:hypothetical protein